MNNDTSIGLSYVQTRIQNALNNWAPNPRMPTLWVGRLNEISKRLGLEPRLTLPPRVYERDESPFIALLTFLTRELDDILTNHPLIVEKEYDTLVREHHNLCTLKYDTAVHTSIARIESSRQDVVMGDGPTSHNEHACLSELAESFEQEFPQLAQAIGIRDLVQNVPLHPCDEGPYDTEYYMPACLLVFEALLQPAIEADLNAYVAWKLFKEQQSA